MKNVVLSFHTPNEMAEIRYNRKVLAFGNYWDFHTGVRGCCFIEVGDKQVPWPDSIRGPMSVARLVADHFGVEVEIKYRKIAFPGC